LAMARLPLDGAQEHLPARDNRIPGHWITVPKSCLRHGPWLQSSQLAICFFSGVPKYDETKAGSKKYYTAARTMF
jgi:hypothetical protein